MARAAEAAGGAEFARAKSLIDGGKYEEALALLRRIAPDHPREIEARFMWGFAALNAARRADLPGAEREALLREATRVFHAIVTANPDFHRVRVELARAFFLLEEDNLARAHFRRVLAGDPPPPVAANIRRFLAAIRSRRRWDAYFSVAVAPDSNINSATDERGYYQGGGQFTFNEDARSKSGVGVVFAGGLEYQHPLGDKWRLIGGADVVRNDHRGAAFDGMRGVARGGLRRLVGAGAEWRLLATAAQNWTAGSRRAWDGGGRFEFRQRLSKRLSARARVSWSERRHRRGEDKPLDGARKGFLLRAEWSPAPAIQFSAGAEWLRGLPRHRPSRYRRRRASVGAGVLLPGGWSLRASWEWAGARHDAGGSLFTPNQEARQDRQTTVALRALNRGWTIGGFSPQLGLIREERRSNSVLHRFSRDRAELRFIRQF